MPVNEDFAPSYVCTKCYWVGTVLAEHEARCNYAAADVNQKAREAVAALRTRLSEVEAQLPEGMRNCTIRFRECAAGHGWLTADNWVQHGCPTCETQRAEQTIREQAEALNAMSIYKESYEKVRDGYDELFARIAQMESRVSDEALGELASRAFLSLNVDFPDNAAMQGVVFQILRAHFTEEKKQEVEPK